MQIGRLQQKQAEAAKAVEQLSQDTDAARAALMQALQAEGNNNNKILIINIKYY